MKNTILLTLTTLSLSASVLAQYDGHHGQDGASIFVQAPSLPVQYNTSGWPGGDGGRGRDGGDGRCGTITNSDGDTVRDDVRGDDGGRGGNGGNGGDAGNLFVSYSDLALLKNIHITAAGGSGGSGGPGGRGGWGCPDGNQGSYGSDGSWGRTGSLYLVPEALLPYQEDNSHGSIQIAELLEAKKIVNQVWSSHYGATALLAPGSYIQDTYHHLDGYEYGSAKVVLSDKDLIDPEVLKDSFLVSMRDKVTKISSHSHVMVSHHSDPSPDAVLILDRLYRKHQFDNAAYKEVRGEAGNRQIFISTKGKLVPQPKLNLRLKVEVRGRWWKYYTIFEGPVDQKFITNDEKGYLVHLDSLPLSQKILSGARIRISLEHYLTELSLKSEVNSEVWVLRVD